MELDKLSNILGQDTIKKIYEDIASEPAKEVGKALTDLIKGLRLFTAPIQLLGAYQDKLVSYLERVRQSVPIERQIQSPPSISGPIIERLKYCDEKNPLTDLFLNLLARSIDSDRVNEAHPGFIHVIDQISPDEASLLFVLNDLSGYLNYHLEESYAGDEIKWINPSIDATNLPIDKLHFPHHWRMYLTHLQALNLVQWIERRKIWRRYPPSEGISKKTAQVLETSLELEEFGQLFVKACMPEGEKG